MAANGISGLTLKVTRQQKKLELAQAKRQGRTITEGGQAHSFSGSTNTSAATYKSQHVFETSRLPTTYHSSSNTGALTDNSGTLKPGRPWIYTYIVTVQNVGGNKYFLDGVQQDTLNLSPGTYRFDYSAASSHPFHFSTTSDGTHGSGSLYNVGTTYNASDKFSQIEIADSTPTLYYYCQLHNNMGGQINTP
jgi:hypothetical protein